MKQLINNKQLYVERLIHSYPDDLSILEKVSLSVNGLSNILVLYHASTPIGFLILDFFSEQICGNHASIYEIYIKENYNDNIIRNKLIKEAIKITKEEGFEFISYPVDLSDMEYVENQLCKDYSYFMNKGFHLLTHMDKLYFVKGVSSDSIANIA